MLCMCRLMYRSNITINVEYNQLDPLLRATINPQGDVNDATGFSPFPGNINQLVLKLSTYCAELERHGGVIAEFVNPKYADASKTAFKSSTRLECMMQDFPKNLPEGSRVGFTVVNQVRSAPRTLHATAGNASHPQLVCSVLGQACCNCSWWHLGPPTTSSLRARALTHHPRHPTKGEVLLRPPTPNPPTATPLGVGRLQPREELAGRRGGQGGERQPLPQRHQRRAGLVPHQLLDAAAAGGAR
jgi:hypothetical protein